MGIAACRAKCEAHPKCVAFMYGGKDRGDTICELASTKVPNYSWGNNFRFCAAKECGSGYKQVGTLSSRNDIKGAGLGQTQQPNIAACRAKWEAHPRCVAFMYGGKNKGD